MTLEERVEALEREVEALKMIIDVLNRDVPEIRYPDDIEERV